MKTIGWILAAAVATAAAPAFAGDLAVTLDGVSGDGGQMLVSLQTRDQFMKPAGASGAYGPAQAGSQTLVVHDVKPGEYAVMVMHDADSNWEMARQADGKPLEGWAMSGNWAGKGKPTFDQTRIVVPADGGAVTLRMVYP